ncbi:hypothetical protein IPJ72_00090 [Candidatus Peregrinibacteria bacterium]|nr:MAG: hypothetical protein IPJ72_00090 [Candidatus Peregrinibacteria bacterium]
MDERAAHRTERSNALMAERHGYIDRVRADIERGRFLLGEVLLHADYYHGMISPMQLKNSLDDYPDFSRQYAKQLERFKSDLASHSMLDALHDMVQQHYRVYDKYATHFSEMVERGHGDCLARALHTAALLVDSGAFNRDDLRLQHFPEHIRVVAKVDGDWYSIERPTPAKLTGNWRQGTVLTPIDAHARAFVGLRVPEEFEEIPDSVPPKDVDHFDQREQFSFTLNAVPTQPYLGRVPEEPKQEAMIQRGTLIWHSRAAFLNWAHSLSDLSPYAPLFVLLLFSIMLGRFFHDRSEWLESKALTGDVSHFETGLSSVAATSTPDSSLDVLQRNSYTSFSRLPYSFSNPTNFFLHCEQFDDSSRLSLYQVYNLREQLWDFLGNRRALAPNALFAAQGTYDPNCFRLSDILENHCGNDLARIQFYFITWPN